MKVFKTVIGLIEEPNLMLADTIWHEGKLWIVPKWLVSPEEKCSRPERMVRIDQLPHQQIDRKLQANHPAEYVLNVPMPKAVLRGQIDAKTAIEYEVLLQPDIKLPATGRQLH